jgi:hypothetical protein
MEKITFYKPSDFGVLSEFSDGGMATNTLYFFVVEVLRQLYSSLFSFACHYII